MATIYAESKIYHFQDLRTGARFSYASTKATYNEMREDLIALGYPAGCLQLKVR